MEGTIADVRCPNCGAPAHYDIIRQNYLCGSCGSRVEVSEAAAQKQGFRSMQQEKIRSSAKQYRLMRAACSGCGAEVIFNEGEALSNCSFCGRALVRKDYMVSKDMPEMIIPFRITKNEAVECLLDWCGKNSGKTEAKHLKNRSGELQGFYLPYELIRGPVTSRVCRIDTSRDYHCRGYVDEVFVNCSKQLDNLLLDAAEPFELEDLKPFDYSFTAGQRIKIRDIDGKELSSRVSEEISSDYTPSVIKVLKTEAVNVDTNTDSVLRLPVLLPVYCINADGIIAAVNGQTGKVSVRAEKQSWHIFLPWWLKAIIATLVITGAAFAGFRLFGTEAAESLIFSGALGLVTLIVTLCAYSDTVRNPFRVEAARKIFTSRGGALRRSGTSLVRDEKELRKETVPPVFFENLNGTPQPVQLVFATPRRILRIALLAVTALFLPVIIALLLNGFDFGKLNLGGSAVWFCIMVPVVPIYILKFAVIELYERPWIYLLKENGTRKRYREKRDHGISVKDVLKALIIPPASLAVWFGIISFLVMCWLTAFGWD